MAWLHGLPAALPPPLAASAGLRPLLHYAPCTRPAARRAGADALSAAVQRDAGRGGLHALLHWRRPGLHCLLLCGWVPPVAGRLQRVPTQGRVVSSDSQGLAARLACLPAASPGLSSPPACADFPAAPLFDPREGRLLSNVSSWRTATAAAQGMAVSRAAAAAAAALGRLRVSPPMGHLVAHASIPPASTPTHHGSWGGCPPYTMPTWACSSPTAGAGAWSRQTSGCCTTRWHPSSREAALRRQRRR